ncbi:hypothetical protein PHJA_000645900 [Phtheirospermum japonicum]|uniref:Uncharacterized protein n=1 Tax=Phtheirospermum japonicum TaxID=374723 RepID=A0A830BSL0_9LAMI|nr:hypothetical protein PHJA_000645900 [Phtheirospermum japonicum]
MQRTSSTTTTSHPRVCFFDCNMITGSLEFSIAFMNDMFFVFANFNVCQAHMR